MAESSEPMPQEDANALGVSSPSARASIIEVPAVRPALSKDGTTRTVTAQPPRRARSDTAMLPRYIRPLTRKDAPPRASSDGGESSESSALAEPRATSSASTGPRSRTTAKLAVAAHRQPSADAAETDRPAYIEVTPRTLSAEEQLLSDFHTAADAYKEGAFAEAERLLKELIGRDQGQHRARLLLARLYTDRDLDELAEAVLSQGLLHYPRHAPYAGFYAQILARQGRDDAAIALLRKALPAAHENAELHALLAGLYRRTGDPSAAARSYLTALRIDPTPGEWWTGLGISSEQAGDGDMAQDAYRKALQSPLTGEVEQYVKQRLRELLAKRTNDNGHRDKADLKS